jgi:HSP20 family protein
MFDMTSSERREQFRHEMESLLRDFFGEGRTSEPSEMYPALNIWEDPQHVYVESELPGIALEKVDISVANDQLTLRGERQTEEKEGLACHRRERDMGDFVRMVRLPSPVDADHAEASLKNGVLSIMLPKSERARPRRIDIKTPKQS